MNVIYEDAGLLIVHKAAGQLTQSGKSFDLDLTSEVLAYRKKKGEAAYAAVINRLDRPVSGLVVFAKDREAAKRLSKQMQQGEFGKQYYAIVCGTLPEEKGILTDYLVTDKTNNRAVVVQKDDDGAKRAELEYESLGTRTVGENIYSLLKIRLITGRHHQIRIQFASRNLPLAGDVKYGIERRAEWEQLGIGRQEIALCAYLVEVDKKTYRICPNWLWPQL